MPVSNYLKALRLKVGNDLLLLPSVAAVLKDDGGRILFQKKPDGTWSLPAGMIEPDESPAQAVIREVAEETGLTVEVVGIAGAFGGSEFSYTYANGDAVQYTVVVFRCKIVAGSLGARDEETAELHFFSKDQRPRLELPYPETIFD